MTTLWHGYSERGLVNALFESALWHPEGATILARLFERAWHPPWARPDGSIREMRRTRLWPRDAKIEDAEVFIEHSLSDFGEPDALILMTARLVSGERLTKALMLEAKRETWSKNVRYQAKNLRQNASSILHELFLKSRLADYLYSPALNQLIKTDSHPGVRVYAHDKKRYRHIGQEPMVRQLVDRLAQPAIPCFFLALTTTPNPTPEEASRPDGWSAGLEMASDIARITLENDITGKTTADSVGNGWLEATSHLSWDDVADWAHEEGLERMTRTLEENVTKLDRRP
ncbi:MAG: hypothetical protein ACPGU1_18720 [Myxococcota bacterium]